MAWASPCGRSAGCSITSASAITCGTSATFAGHEDFSRLVPADSLSPQFCVADRVNENFLFIGSELEKHDKVMAEDFAAKTEFTHLITRRIRRSHGWTAAARVDAIAVRRELVARA